MIWLVAIFIASNRIFTEGICKLCDLIISDLIDEDYIKNHRQVFFFSQLFHRFFVENLQLETFCNLVLHSKGNSRVCLEIKGAHNF